MPFERGHKKLGGVKKGQKQTRTLFREILEAEYGESLPVALGSWLKTAKQTKDWGAFTELLRIALPYCYKKMPVDHTLQTDIPQQIDYSAILATYGIQPRRPKEMGQN